MEGQTAGVLLRIEESTGIIRGFEVLAWSRRIAAAIVMIPEVTDPEFQAEWIKNQLFIRDSE
jgi:hypothetical protein